MTDEIVMILKAVFIILHSNNAVVSFDLLQIVPVDTADEEVSILRFFLFLFCFELIEILRILVSS